MHYGVRHGERKTNRQDIAVAMHDGTGLQYLLTDHLGSTVAVTNASGTLTSQQRYLPFGETRTIPNSPILGTDFGYTGQRKLDDGMGGIMDYKARFYSPALSRFIQPDTIIPYSVNPQSWNRYSYVTNRPINFNDPTGHFAIVIAGVVIPPLIAVAGIVALSMMVCNAISPCHEAMIDGLVAADGYISKKSLDLYNTFQQKVNDTNRGNRFPIGKCAESASNLAYCILGAIVIGGSILIAGTTGGCDEPESNSKCPPEPTQTNTPTHTPTSTTTPTSTLTSTPTASPTSTNTPTPTNIPTVTPTLTLTPTFTPLPRYRRGLLDME